MSLCRETCSPTSPRRSLALLAAVALCLLSAISPARADKAPGAELTVLIWPDYVAPTAIRAFEWETGSRVRQIHFETDETRDRAMAESDGTGFDVLCLDNTALDAYRTRGWIVPLDPGAIRNRRHLDPRWDSAYPASRGYAVPYFWGTLGIVYRRDLTGRDLSSWMDLLRPNARLRGRILMVADALDLMGVALKALGYSMNSADPQELNAAADLLRDQHPAVRRYGALGVSEESEVLTGAVAAAVSYNGDGAALRGRNPQVAFAVPREGGALWVDYLAIAARARQPALAAAFIDFLNRPAIAADNARQLSYATPNRAAERLLPSAFLADPLIYPDPATLARCETYAPLSPEALAARFQAYAAIVHGD